MESSKLPGILTIGINNTQTEDMIKMIVGENNIAGTFQANCWVYNWKIDNKYYTADVHLYSPVSKDIHRETFANLMEAIIFYVDHITDDLTSELDDWIIITNNCGLDVKILVFNNVIPEEKKDLISRWCLRNQFESVELEFHNDSHNGISDDGDDDDGDDIGINRVVQALHAHQWSSLKLKGKLASVKTADSVKTNDGVSSSERDALRTVVSETSSKLANLESTALPKDEPLDQLEELSLLFQNLQSMKNEISSLSGAEKLDKAETVVKAFWNAVGGDSDEFKDSSDEGM